MAKHLLGTMAILAVSVLAFGCSEDDGDGKGNQNPGKLDCSFDACGGDLVGTWEIKGACTTATDFEGDPQCTGAKFSGDLADTGTFTFRGDGTYSQSTRTKGRQHFELPKECIDAMTGGMVTAETYCASLGMGSEIPGSGVTGECVYAGDKCTCDLNYDSEFSWDGDYTISGNKVSLGSTSEYEYCVSGKALKLSEEGVVTVLERKDDTGEGGSGQGGSGGSGQGGSGGSGEGGSGGSGEGGSGGSGEGGSGEGGSGGSGEGGSGGSGEGGSGGSGQTLVCETFEPCGGDPVGTWDVVESCATEDTISVADGYPPCDAVPYSLLTEFTGSLTYTASTERSTLRETGTETITVTEECLSVLASTFGMTCTDLVYDWQPTDYDMVEGDCVLTFELDLDYSGNLSYEVSGTQLGYPGQQFETPFCVSGDSLAQDWGPMNLVFQKR
jgi:hypothetical protein